MAAPTIPSNALGVHPVDSFAKYREWLQRLPRPAAQWTRLLGMAVAVGIGSGLAAAALEAGLYFGSKYVIGQVLPDTQRRMIAEINAPFKPDLVVLDGIDAFVDGGPMTGKRARGNVFMASTDRVAIDAAGLAVLKSLGSNHQIMNTRIFQQEQISRAVDIGIGAASPTDIELVAADEPSRAYRDRVAAILNEG